jgi:glycosyltransferase involved in cell wall biosynthesis
VRIAQIAPLHVQVPPQRYGGTERVVHALTEGLVRRGHQVTLFAAGGSQTNAELHATSSRPLWQMELADPLAYRVLQVEELVRRSSEFDLIHSHVDYLPWLAGERLRAPLVSTLHGRLDLPELRSLLAIYQNQSLVSISGAQRRPVDDLRLNWVATVHHGLDLATTFQLGTGHGCHLVFLGRISAEKDPGTAIRVAIGASMPLHLVARVDPSDQPFFESKVRPLLDHPLIHWHGELDDAAKGELLGRATAMLLPIDWDEPFGLAFIEALACGTPVVSRPRGALPELIRHGEHGFLVWTEAEMVEACRRAPGLERAACRTWALDHFSAERMVADYERVYKTVLEGALQVTATPASHYRKGHTDSALEVLEGA